MTTKPNPVPAVGVTAYLSPPDATAAIAFYTKAFGAEEVAHIPTEDGKRVMHSCLRINGGLLMMSDPFPEHGYPFEKPQGFVLHLQVDDVDAWWKRATEAGCEVTMKLEKQFWGDRYGQVRDPFGFTWSMGASAA